MGKLFNFTDPDLVAVIINQDIAISHKIIYAK